LPPARYAAAAACAHAFGAFSMSAMPRAAAARRPAAITLPPRNAVERCALSCRRFVPRPAAAYAFAAARFRSR